MCFSGTRVSLMQVYYVKDQQLWLIRISVLVGLNVILKWGEKSKKNPKQNMVLKVVRVTIHILFS